MTVPYFSEELEEMVNTDAEDALVKSILDANVEQLKRIRLDMLKKVALNRSVAKSHEYRLVRKGIAYKNKMTKRKLALEANRFSLMEMISGFQYRMIIHDEWWKRFIGQ